MLPPAPGAHELMKRWAVLCRDAGLAVNPRTTALGEELIARYQEAHRHYHGIEHLAAVLVVLDELTEPEPPPVATRLAVWFHDAIYRGRAGQDEAESAELAEQRLASLGLSPGLVARVSAMVRATATHTDASAATAQELDHPTQLLLDADLSILGQTRPVYDRYVNGVRQEYAQVPDAQFVAGRTAVVRALVERSVLFHTPQARRRFETAARRNLQRELDRLRARVNPSDGSPTPPPPPSH